MTKYKIGDVIIGIVTGIEKYGVFISVDDTYNGLIHISEISDNFVSDLNDYVIVGEKIKVKILEIDELKNHLKLSIKNLDYRLTKPKNHGIIETESGFSTLEKNLHIWMEKKLEEIHNQK